MTAYHCKINTILSRNSQENSQQRIAVTHLVEKLGLSKEETMAIGDEENDRVLCLKSLALLLLWKMVIQK